MEERSRSYPSGMGLSMYMVDASGANETVLVENAATNHSPEWSPDGSELAFITDSDTLSGIYLVKIEDHEVYKLLDGYFHYAGLTWKE